MKRKVFICIPILLLIGQALFAQESSRVVSIGPIRKALATGQKDTIIVCLPPSGGLAYPGCGRIDTVQNFPSARWSCNPPQTVNWNGYIRASIQKIGQTAGFTSDSLRISAFYVNDDGYLSGGSNARVYWFGSSSTYFDASSGAIFSNPNPISMDPARALAIELHSADTDTGAVVRVTRWELRLDIY